MGGSSLSRCLTAVFACALAGPGAPGTWGQWVQIHKLTADDAAWGDQFGWRAGAQIGGSSAIRLVG